MPNPPEDEATATPSGATKPLSAATLKAIAGLTELTARLHEDASNPALPFSMRIQSLLKRNELLEQKHKLETGEEEVG